MDKASYIDNSSGGLANRVGRWAWIVTALLMLGLTLYGSPGRYSQLIELGQPNANALTNLGLSLQFYASFGTALDLTIVIAHFAIAAFIFWRCTNKRVAVIVPFALIAGGAIIPFTNMFGEASDPLAVEIAVNLILFLGLLGSIALLYLFPDGRFVPPWTKVLAVIWALLAFTAVFFPQLPFSLPGLPAGVRLFILVAWSGSGIYAQTYRYVYVSNPVQKQQTKWGVFGLVLAVMGPIGFFFPLVAIPSFAQPEIPNFLYNAVGQSFFDSILFFQLIRFLLFTIIVILFPLSFAVAILRYRLWDIDIIIRKTLVYGALSLALAGIYVAIVILLQGLFQAISGESRSTFVTVVSTLVIAALFGPLRRRVQDTIDRRFYRQKYNAANALTAFSQAARDEVDLDRLAASLLNVVDDTIHPSCVSIWLKPRKEA